MLSILKRRTVQIGSQTWEYHGDDTDTTIFYITPIPDFSKRDDGLPAIQIVEFQTSGADNGTGYCQFQIELTIPDNIIPAIKTDISQQFQVANPNLQALPVQAGTIVNLTYPDGQGGTTGVQADGTDFGSNAAIFDIPLSIDQMKEIKTTMAQQGSGPFQIEYSLVVPCYMPGVTATLSFDANIAYDYEVTVERHEHSTEWSTSVSYTYDIQQYLSQSNASKIEIDKIDPKIPDSVVDSIRTWGQNTIENLIQSEVQEALAIQGEGSGTQSFSISEVSSFSETYTQSETITWRIAPQIILPTFVDLNLTTVEIQQLEPVVDQRQFTVSVLPNVIFSGSENARSHIQANILSGTNLFKDGIEKLKYLDVTIQYPTLQSSSTKTFRFTDNKANTWQSDWDDTAKGVFTLSYVAVYEDGQQITGTKNNLDVTMYTLGLEDIGILSVNFDASRFFTAEAKEIDSIEIDLVFNIPDNAPYLQTFELTSEKSSQQISSWLKAPLTTEYAYTITYNFKQSVSANPYTSNVKQSNSNSIRINQPDFTKDLPVLIHIGSADNPDFIAFSADIYYDDTPYFPNISASAALPAPTQSSPITLSIDGTETTAIVRKVATMFANNSLSTLKLSASGTGSDGTQLTWGPFDFDPTNVPNGFSFFKDNEFTFIEVDPSIVDWQGGLLKQINILITNAYYTCKDQQVTVPMGINTIPIRIDPQKKIAPSAFQQILNIPFGYSALSFDWTASYLYESGSKYASGQKQAGNMLVLPVNATDVGSNKPTVNSAQNSRTRTESASEFA